MGFYLVPAWFLWVDVGLQLIFAAITLVVSIFSFKIYRLTQQRSIKHFGLAFAFIAASYFVQAIVNVILYLHLRLSTSYNSLDLVSILSPIGFYLHMVLLITGLVTLAYITLRIKSFKTYTLLLLITILTLIATFYNGHVYHIVSSVLLLYVVLFYFGHYFRNRSNDRAKPKRSLLVATGFGCILLSHMNFIFSLDRPIYYVLGFVLSLLGYLLILINLLLITKHEKKK